jgi:hypothetical protein
MAMNLRRRQHWRGGQLLQAATPSTSGGVTTRRWALPANSRRPTSCMSWCTLTQDGTPLTWDKHGYYEASLDA